jgi:hydroxymethylbilane synthase
MVRDALAALHPGLHTEILPIKTRGDDPTSRWGADGIKGLFVREIEDALLSGRVDLAVHSAKDLPARLPGGLILAAPPERATPFDALVAPGDPRSVASLPKGARVGTSSLRRRAQLLALRPDLKIIAIRGNLATRAAKAQSGECDAVVLAEAGILRLGAAGPPVPYRPIAPSEMLPAPCQGILALELREGDSRVAGLVAPLGDSESELALLAERAFMEALGAGCQAPAAAWARDDPGGLFMEALVAELDGTAVVRASGRAQGAGPEGARALGSGLAGELLSNGGSGIIERAEREGSLEWGE